jgi:carbonic anhydrase
MEDYKRLLTNNKAWVKDKLAVRDDFFESMAGGQQPPFLWIGCSDSRVPAELITGTGPGELFVHRNVANMVIPTDLNLGTVLEYGVDHLKVQHIIVCGHYGCGGVAAAASQQDLGRINNWLGHIKDVYVKNSAELDAISDDTARLNRLVECNVIEQVAHLAGMDFIQKMWKTAKQPMLHGWVYDLHSGTIKDLLRVEPGSMSKDIFDYKL